MMRLKQAEPYNKAKGLTFQAPAPKGPGGVQVEHRIGVQAPAHVIWSLIYDLAGWPRWNPLYVQASGDIRIGSELELTLALEGEPQRVIRPTVLEWVPDNQLHWKLKMAGGLVSNVRYIEIESLDVASCIISNGEFLGGLLGPQVAKRMGRKLWRGFEGMNQALKAEAEAAWRAQNGAPTSEA